MDEMSMEEELTLVDEMEALKKENEGWGNIVEDLHKQIAEQHAYIGMQLSTISASQKRIWKLETEILDLMVQLEEHERHSHGQGEPHIHVEPEEGEPHDA